MTGFESKWNYKIQITKRKKICFCLWISLTLPKTFPTLFLSSLDLFIGQARSQTCSGRALLMERVGGKLGKTASDRGGDWFSRTRDRRHRVWRSARHGCWRPVMLVTDGSCWKVTVNPSQSVTVVTLKLDNSGLVPFFVFSPNFAVSAHGGLYYCVPET